MFAKRPKHCKPTDFVFSGGKVNDVEADPEKKAKSLWSKIETINMLMGGEDKRVPG